jgi:succinate dehydrogenase/fumarate reductase flavoprotein subunit
MHKDRTMTAIGRKIPGIQVHRYHTVIVGAGAAGMNCAVHLCEFLAARGVPRPADHVAVVTAGLGLGASRMSGSDKQTYYKIGTSPDVPDSAAAFAATLTAAGCVHEDLALAEAVGSLREFYHLVQAGVPFPHNGLGSYVGYKTDHDPAQRATSAGPKASQMMSRQLEDQVRRLGVTIFDRQEVARLIARGRGPARRLAGVLTVDRTARGPRPACRYFACENLVLAAGGPGELYQTTVYPRGQLGLHGLALEAGLEAENLTESQFGLASTAFRWNVSGTYMQAVPRVFSTDADGRRPRDFLAAAFPTLRQMATAIFLKGYQWPFDPQRVEGHQSSLIDMLVFDETRRGRRVFLDFRHNPRGRRGSGPFRLQDLAPEARTYLRQAGALQARPIDRLARMNPPAIDIYAEHGIDLHREPLEIAVCAQHNNGGMAVNAWWESTVRHTFVIGEMAGTHGVKRPGGSALNAGQVGGLRAAEYIAAMYPPRPAPRRAAAIVPAEVKRYAARLVATFDNPRGLAGREVLRQIASRMTASAAHVREEAGVRTALDEAVDLCHRIERLGFRAATVADVVAAIRARHLALTSAAYLKAILVLLESGGGSRGSYLVLANVGPAIHPLVTDPATGRPLHFKPENPALRRQILRVRFDPRRPDLFACRAVAPRRVRLTDEVFEVAWDRFRQGKIYT